MGSYHLAQINIGRVRAPVDDPIMEGFMSRLDEINALAEATPGFVWRLQSDSGNATDIHVYEDDRLLVNMSVWESIEALNEFTYKSMHSEPLRMRKEWFEKMDTPYVALWWIPVGHTPTALEGKERLAHLQQHGPTPTAFTFKTRFPMPEGEVAR